MKKFVVILFLSFFAVSFAQNDLLDELEVGSAIDSSQSAAFKGLKIINLESTKLAGKKDLYFIIAHRFGSVKTGLKDLFGLDQSTIRFSFVYGITDDLTIGISRSSFFKTYDFSLKYMILQQKLGGSPLTVVGYNSMAINTDWDDDIYTNYSSEHRYGYVSKLLISRKFTDKFSLEGAPIVLHENYVDNYDQENTQFALGFGTRYKLSKFVTLNVDYAYHLNRSDLSNFNNPFSVGLDIETGGHVFQVHFTNAQPMHEIGYLTRASGDWGDGDIYFGFNLLRVF